MAKLYALNIGVLQDCPNVSSASRPPQGFLPNHQIICHVVLNSILVTTSSSMINYNNRQFRPVQNTANGETSQDTIFHYKQEGNVLTSTYSGGRIQHGHLLGLVDADGCIDMRYHQVNDRGALMTGTCRSVPEVMPSGKIRLNET